MIPGFSAGQALSARPWLSHTPGGSSTPHATAMSTVQRAKRQDEVVPAHAAGGPWHTDTRCYGVVLFCQDCNFDVCGNWYACGVCFGFPF
jgi:hypothetical protein